MTYARLIQEKKFPWGGRALAATLPAGKSVSLFGSVAMGSRSSADDELASVHAAMLLEGTKRRSKKELQVELDALGASLSLSAASDRLVWSARVRTPHLERLLSLICEILREPAFPRAELEILKVREQANLSMQAQDTYAQASIALSRMLYPKDHPNYEQTTPEAQAALKKVSVKALEAYHAKGLNRGSLVLSAAGDITAPRFFALAQKHFSLLPERKVRELKPRRPLPQKAARKAVRIKEKASIDYMAAIAPNITNQHKEYAAFVLGLQVLGNRGGFTGRLMQIVREQEGLTYGVYSYPTGFAHDTAGHILAWGTFASQLFERGRGAILREMARIAGEGATKDEVCKHGKLYEARAKVSLSSSSSIARAAHDTVVDKKPLAYLDTFPKRVAKLSVREVNNALKKHLKVGKLSEAAAGPIEKF